MNRNEEVKPSFRAEFTPHKSTKNKTKPEHSLPENSAKTRQETPPPRIIRPVTENRKQKSAARSQLSNLFRRYR